MMLYSTLNQLDYRETSILKHIFSTASEILVLTLQKLLFSMLKLIFTNKVQNSVFDYMIKDSCPLKHRAQRYNGGQVITKNLIGDISPQPSPSQ